MITLIGDTLPVFYYEKMVGYTPSSFANLDFAGERIKMGLKRGKFDHPALTNRKPGANREDEKEEGTHVVIIVPTWPNSPANNPKTALLITHHPIIQKGHS